ncbi:hypothetical protein OJF2_25260 [Aquisphaera giovannonii]|uniref:Uncharacterized protein n=1 Tax=Aquisphaera giovannonii TaxID=406548 RepID=A0A5B9W0E2_9BACT|nr:hypothetical protein [Aquisphaera giovannonii]QEH33993.1 hypothetical protein OJF2_25260 [Aquisphaera giovannonii]
MLAPRRLAGPATLLAAILSIGLTTSRASGDEAAKDATPSAAGGVKLLGEGDRLADEGKPNEAVVRYKSAFEQILPALRHIPFKHEVKRDVTRREAMKDMLLKEFEEDMTPEEFRTNELAMKAFGLIPRETDLKAMIVQVYSEEVAAFYDPKTKTMHLIEEPEEVRKAQPSFLERLFGKRGGFDKDENKTVIAHELTHALADQHYDLQKLHKDAKNDDDRAMAVSSLIEGEATLAMIGAQMEDWDGTRTPKLPAADLDRTMTFLGPFMSMMGGGKSLKSAPPIISETLIFPYLRGMVFCAWLANKGGWKAIDDAYRNPPASTEQILHPEKFLGKPDLPTVIDLGKVDPGPPWKEIGRNVLGELQTAIMLGRQGSKAAAGWDGDRYAIFEGPGDKLALVWFSTWDSPEEAREFAEAYVRYQTKRQGKKGFQPETIPAALWRCQDDSCQVVERRGADVVVVEGFPPVATGRLVESAFHATKAEFQPPKGSPQPADTPSPAKP